MKNIKYFLLFICVFFINLIFVNADELSFSAHVANIGWFDVGSNQVIGTTGRGLRLEAFKINKGNLDGEILYKSYVEGIGWQDYVSSGNISGTTNQAKKIEMVQIKLDGELSNTYDVYYRVHVANIGWLDWACNDQITGTLGYNYQIEALEIKLINKEDDVSFKTSDIYREKQLSFDYSAHVANIGWFNVDVDGVIGTTGRGLRLEAFKINKLTSISGDVLYRSYVEGIGWQDYVSSGNISGTTNQAKKIEMVQIKLDGELSDKYDVYYRVHVANIGWLDWACNDQVTGTFGYRNQIEALQIKLIKKGDTAPANSTNIYREKDINVNYQTYFNNKWQDVVSDGSTSGTVGQAIPINAFRIKISDVLGNWILYRSYSSGKWDDYKSNNAISGKLSSNNYIEMIQLKLNSEASILYNIYYRVHVSNIGWLDWACNDQVTGTLGYGNRIEAMEIKLVRKNESFDTGNNIYIEKNNYLTYTTHIQDYGWTDYVYETNVLGKVNSKKRIEAIKIKLNNMNVSGNIKYSAHVEGIGWQDYVSSDEMAGTSNMARRLEAIKIELEGEISNLYDVYYRSCVEDFGWLDWAKNGEISGSVTIAKKMEAIEIMLVNKDDSAPGKTETTYVDSVFRTIDGKVYYYENGTKVTGFKVINGIKYFFNSEGVLIANKVKKIIDVSVYQGDVDWNSVKNTDVDGAILRLGYGTSYTTDACVLDKKFERNYNATKSLNLLYGIYLYSYAVDTTSANIEANFVVDKLKHYNVSKDVVIYYDLEENPWTTNLSKAAYHDIVSTFISTVEKEGYHVKVYSYKYWAENRLDNYVNDKLDWIAQYSNYCTYNGSYKGWQYTSSGRVDGIVGDVDISMFV